MSFQYQAPVDRSLFSFHFATNPPVQMGKVTVKPGENGVFICRDPKADPGAAPCSRRQALLGRCGLVTPWPQLVDTEAEYQYLCTAKVETAANCKGFNKVWASGRHCIVPVQSFQKSSHTKRWPEHFRISSRSDEPLGVAGLWTLCKLKPGIDLYSFALLTTSADSDPILRHLNYPGQPPRMPLIVHKSQYDAWLDVSPENSMELIHKLHKVSLRTGSPKEKTKVYGL